MIKIKSGSEYVGTEFFVLDIGSEPTEVDFGQQIDDLLICSNDADLLISWDLPEWDDNRCLMVRQFDNLKEISNVRCTRVMLKCADPDKSTKLYLTVQRN